MNIIVSDSYLDNRIKVYANFIENRRTNIRRDMASKSWIA